MTAEPEAAQRFPFSDYPKGWFHVAYSRDVAAGEVTSLHYFGHQLICYRGESGTVHVLDAHCPHLGADIAVGGTVRDDCVVEQDIPIWEAKIYRDKPALARGESAITEFRNWAQQSYAAGPR